MLAFAFSPQIRPRSRFSLKFHRARESVETRAIFAACDAGESGGVEVEEKVEKSRKQPAGNGTPMENNDSAEITVGVKKRSPVAWRRAVGKTRLYFTGCESEFPL